MATANFQINPEDGWVAVTASGVAFIRIRQTPDSHTFYVTTGAATPDADERGYPVRCEEFWCDVPVGDNFYVRAANPCPDGDLKIDVFYEV